VWDAATGQPIGQSLTGHTDAVSGVAFSPDGHGIVSGSFDNTLRSYVYLDPASAMCAKTSHRHEPPAVARLGLPRHRLHQGMPGPSGRAGLGFLPKPRSLPRP
jgi:WD40 repeat protein